MDLLLEIGTEELPASFVARALDALPQLARDMLGSARLAHGGARAFGTPRRLALLVDDVAAAQADRDEEVTGPPEKAAFGADGAPTKAAAGFAQRMGVEPSRLYVVETPKGRYVAARRKEAGLPARELLPLMLAQLCGKIPFAKSMRWSDVETPFGRPVHWIVALLGDEVLRLSFAKVMSGRRTRGHRFLDGREHDVSEPGRYVDTLRAAHVLVSPEERRARMLERLHAAAAGDTMVHDEVVEGECLSLVEEPFVVRGSFDRSLLALPEEVIETVIRFHQRYFALRSQDGKLLPAYLTVVNTARSPAIIAKNNDRVCRARLEDARFFVAEDQKKRLESRLPKLDGVVFHHKLGTVGDKVARVRELAACLAPDKPAADRELVDRAATLAKCDLVTLIVGELPELQGVMGRVYALHDGEDPRVADAIRDHYLPRGAGDVPPRDPVAAAVALADRLDTLVGCFGIGLSPSGSADPFALRRAAVGIIRIALDGPFDVDLPLALKWAYQAVGRRAKVLPEADVLDALDEFFRARLRAMLVEEYEPDVVEACLAAWAGDKLRLGTRPRFLRDLVRRLEALDSFRALPEFESLAVAFKRAFNIAKDAPDGSVDPALFQQDEETDLWNAWTAVQQDIEQSIDLGNYRVALERTSELRTAIDRYFEKVFVNVEEEAIRVNRLRQLAAIARTVTRIAQVNLLSTDAREG